MLLIGRKQFRGPDKVEVAGLGLMATWVPKAAARHGGHSSVAWTGHKNDTRHEMHQIRSLVCEILKPNCVLSSLRIALSKTAHTSGAEGLAGSVEAAPMLTQDGFVTGDVTKVSSASDRMPT